jgi:hypothetical protein
LRGSDLMEIREWCETAQCHWYLMKLGIAFAGIGWDNNILQFGTHCMSGSCPLALIRVLFWGLNCLTCDREAIMQWSGQRRTLQIDRIDSYGIGEELCKWQCVYCIVIYWEWGCWLTFSVDFYTCCIKNAQKKLNSTILIAIRCILVSLDSVPRSVGTWHDNIQWLALRIWSSLVLLTSGENA